MKRFGYYHLVICVDEKRAKLLGQEQVIERWTQLYKGGRLVGKKHRGEELSDVEITLLNQDVDKWRLRLSSLSWFLSCLNGFIARKANAEDKCTGRLWEGRFKSQALLDEKQCWLA